MTDHADRIRPEHVSHWWIRMSAVESIGGPPSTTPLVRRADALTALETVLAERQQAIDALREIADLTIARGDTWTTDAAAFARAALLNLGEQP